MSDEPGPEPLHPWPPRQPRPVGILGIVTAVLVAICGLTVVAFFVLLAVSLGFFQSTK